MDTYSLNTADQPISAINTLATTLTDLIRGYETMAEKADPELRPTIERLLALHEGHAARLAEISVQIGGDPDKAGSIMGSVHSAVAHARDAIGQLDERAEAAILRGEDRVLEIYRDALDDLEGQGDIRDAVAGQMQALAAHIEALRN